MNLASQSVLEGLNACFDHRRSLFIAELNKSFEIPADSKCRFFACQNPRAQGGNRRALSKSFVNRFTNIWVDDLTYEDISFILAEVDSTSILTDAQSRAMVACNNRLAEDDHLFGGPFSFNLRDLLRWLHLFAKTGCMSSAFYSLYVSRMRREEDMNSATQLYEELFGEPDVPSPVCCSADERSLVIGQATLPRKKSQIVSSNIFLSSQLPVIGQIASCVEMNWLMNIGKQAAVETVASLTGNSIYSISLTSETDAQELIGSYEQVVDCNVIENTRKSLLKLFSEYSDSIYYLQLRNSTSLNELEAALELLFSEINDAKIVKESRDIIEYASKNIMKFEWIDSVFVKAYLEGDWILLEDVNLCSGAVLDRLNCCLENDGKLVISERKSSFEPLEAHPIFRVFMTMDPKNGEISRAMRNRSVEVYIASEHGWNTSANDLVSMSSNLSGKLLPSQTALALSKLTIERQLFALILLRALDVEDVCRYLALEQDSATEDHLSSPAPLVADIDTDSFVNWQLNSWKGTEHNVLDRILLCYLSASTYVLTSGRMDIVLGPLASPFLQRVISLVKSLSLSKHPLDRRFNGCHLSDSMTSKYTITLICEWAIQTITSVGIEANSAEHMSKTLSKYELHTNENSFKNVALISALVAESIRMLQEVTLDCSSETQAVHVIFGLVYLIRCCRTVLLSRSGSAPIYIAWNQFIDLHPILSPSLTKVVNLMKLGWSCESQELFVTRYLRLYEDHGFLYPFDTEEDNHCFLSQLDKNIVIQTSYDEVTMENDDATESPDTVTSVISEPLLLVNRMHNILTRTHGAFNHVYLSFWSSLKFDPSLSMLSIEDLRHFALTTFTNQLWRLAPNSTILSASICEILDSSVSTFNGWCNVSHGSNWKSRVSFASEMLESALPPMDTLDPVVFKEELYSYYERNLNQVSGQLDILKENRQVISRQSNSACDLNSTHPFISTIFNLRKQLLAEMENNLDQRGAVYRQNAFLYTELCNGMRSFRSLVCEVSSILSEGQEENISQFDSDKCRVKLAQLYSFVNSATSYRQSCLSKYSSFVDVAMTFLVALEILTNKWKLKIKSRKKVDDEKTTERLWKREPLGKKGTIYKMAVD